VLLLAGAFNPYAGLRLTRKSAGLGQEGVRTSAKATQRERETMSNDELTEIDPSLRGDSYNHLQARWVGLDGKPTEIKAMSIGQLLNAIRVLYQRSSQLKAKLEIPKEVWVIAQEMFPIIKTMRQELDIRILNECGAASQNTHFATQLIGPTESTRRFDFIHQEREKEEREQRIAKERSEREKDLFLAGVKSKTVTSDNNIPDDLNDPPF